MDRNAYSCVTASTFNKSHQGVWHGDPFKRLGENKLIWL